MGAFLKFLFIAILVLWVIRLVAARLLPWLLRRFATKMQERAFREFSQHRQEPQQHHQKRSTQRKTEGKINIDYIPPQSAPNKGNSAGEFVDFEEIK